MSRCIAFMILVALAPIAPARAAEFDIDSGQTILRRLQLCSECSSSLLVTHVHPGVMVRCPDCGREQPRLQDKYVITQVYQLCKLCQTPLDPTGLHPGDPVECPNCRTRQTMSRDAFLAPDEKGGIGYNPDYPPGKGKKRLLFDSGADNSLAKAGIGIEPELPKSLPDRDGPVPVAPLAATLPDAGQSAVPTDVAFRPGSRIQEPPRQQMTPPLPEPSPEAFSPASSPAALAAQDSTTSQAIDVPSVSADMFGGRPRTATAEATATTAGPGAIVARVNGRPIHAGVLEFASAAGIQAIRAAGTDAASKTEREKDHRTVILRQLIDRELVAEEAERVGFKPDPVELRKRAAGLTPLLANTGLDPEREAYRELALQAIREQLAIKPEAISPKAVHDYYNAHKQGSLQPPQIAIATLTIFRDRYNKSDQRDYRAIAREVAEQLEQGIKFDDLRSRYNEFAMHDGSGASQPKLLPVAHYAEEIRDMTASLPAGAVFGPVFMPGVAVFGKITEVREPTPVPFAEVEKDIRRRLVALESEKKFAAWLEDVRRQAVVSF